MASTSASIAAAALSSAVWTSEPNRIASIAVQNSDVTVGYPGVIGRGTAISGAPASCSTNRSSGPPSAKFGDFARAVCVDGTAPLTSVIFRTESSETANSMKAHAASASAAPAEVIAQARFRHACAPCCFSRSRAARISWRASAYRLSGTRRRQVSLPLSGVPVFGILTEARVLACDYHSLAAGGESLRTVISNE